MWQIRKEAILAIPDACYSKEQRELWAMRDLPDGFVEILKTDCWYVGLLSGRIIATGGLDPVKKSLEGLFVQPAYQGQGIAGLLLREVEQLAVAKSYKKIVLESTPVAEGFYKKHGFKSLEKASYCAAAGLKLPCVRMEKKLN